MCVPLTNPAVDRAVVDERIDSGENKQQKLDSEGRIRVGLGSLGSKQHQAAYRQNGEADPDDRKYLARHGGDALAAQKDAEQAQVQNRDRAGEERDGKNVGGLDDGKDPQRLAQSCRRASVIEPLAEVMNQFGQECLIKS